MNNFLSGTGATVSAAVRLLMPELPRDLLRRAVTQTNTDFGYDSTSYEADTSPTRQPGMDGSITTDYCKVTSSMSRSESSVLESPPLSPTPSMRDLGSVCTISGERNWDDDSCSEDDPADQSLLIYSDYKAARKKAVSTPSSQPKSRRTSLDGTASLGKADSSLSTDRHHTPRRVKKPPFNPFLGLSLKNASTHPVPKLEKRSSVGQHEKQGRRGRKVSGS